MKPDVPAWWHQAQRQGLVPADAQPPHAAPSVPRWVWVQQANDPARWLDLRRALQRACA